jgi:archaellum component FlaC
MAVMPREKWTDERLDDLNAKVDVGFASVDKRFDKVDKRFDKVDKRFDAVDARFEKVEDKIEGGIKELRGEMDTRFEAMNGHFLALHRLLLRASIGAAVAFGVALIGLFAGFFAS